PCSGVLWCPEERSRHRVVPWLPWLSAPLPLMFRLMARPPVPFLVPRPLPCRTSRWLPPLRTRRLHPPDPPVRSW
ncbi:unnamed protein product, partial [Nesidiocoris tenuis]